MSRVANSNVTDENTNKMIGNNYSEDEWEEIDWMMLRATFKEGLRTKDDKDRKMLMKAIMGIRSGYDADEDVAQFLEDIDSTLVYHRDPRKWTKREIVCAYMNTICVWSDILRNDSNTYDDGVIRRLNDVYAGLKDFVINDLGRSMRKVMDYKSFKAFISKHALVRPYNSMFETTRLTSDSICGLRQYKKY